MEAFVTPLIVEAVLWVLGVFLVGIGIGMLIERYRIKGNLKP
jgi:hypothetical protein